MEDPVLDEFDSDTHSITDVYGLDTTVSLIKSLSGEHLSLPVSDSVVTQLEISQSSLDP